MRPIEALRSIASRQFVNSDGESAQVKLIRGDVPNQSDQTPSDPEVDELLRLAAGFELDAFEVRFDGCGGGQYTPGFGCDRALLEDGFGNSWNVDINPRTGRWGPVYFMCHDPPVVVLQSRSLADFILDVAKQVESDDENGPLDTIHDVAAMRIWERGGVEMPSRDMASRDDPVLESAAKVAGPRGLVVDMRSAKPGDGYRWVTDDCSGELRRIGESAVWAMLPE